MKQNQNTINFMFIHETKPKLKDIIVFAKTICQFYLDVPYYTQISRCSCYNSDTYRLLDSEQKKEGVIRIKLSFITPSLL